RTRPGLHLPPFPTPRDEIMYPSLQTLPATSPGRGSVASPTDRRLLSLSMMGKRELLSHMGHQLREPLFDFLGCVDGVQRGTYGPLFGELRSAMSYIRDGLKRSLELVANVVELGRLDSGDIQPAAAPCELNRICDTGIQLSQAIIDSKSLQLFKEI